MLCGSTWHVYWTWFPVFYVNIPCVIIHEITPRMFTLLGQTDGQNTPIMLTHRFLELTAVMWKVQWSHYFDGCYLKHLVSNWLEWMPWNLLTHWGRVMHICVVEITIIGSDNGLSPGRRQAIIWTSVEILFIEPLRTNFSEILIEIHTFSFKEIDLKMSSGNRRPFVSASIC